MTRARGSLDHVSNTYAIRTFGDPVLRERAGDVEELDGHLAGVVRNMFDTMYEAPGLGLAAPQVGVRRRLFVYDIGDGPEVFVNPVIEESGGVWAFEEGCLSIPGLSFVIERPRKVTLRGLDLQGREQVVVGDELLGRVFLHELDHLDGVLLIDRLEGDDRKVAMRVLRERAMGAAPASGALRPAPRGAL